MTVQQINNEIKNKNIDTNEISDGYHTFGELYDHRITLYIALCKLLKEKGYDIWYSFQNSDGSVWDGWFLLGINDKKGEQITYHLNTDYLPIIEDCNVAEYREIPPEFDGHTSNDVLRRLIDLICEISE